MIQNLKIDIIYYDTPSDFEFEFNLGGCCHSRVLNNRTSSPKEMIDCLSKAVGRSRVILIVGKLDGSDGLYSLISKAIGLPLCEVNADEYGISAKSDTSVIANSLPLVSTDGLLAGCIIESGPQSIILLPGAKSLRKDIAENLVFQYITAVSRTPDTETVATPDSATEEEIIAEPAAEEVDAEAPVTEEENIEEPVIEEPVIEESVIEEEATEEESGIQTEIFAEQDISLAEEAEDPTKEEKEEEPFIDIFAETPYEESADIDSNYVYNTHPETEDDGYDQEDFEDDYEDNKKQSSGINTFIWIILGLMFIIAAILVYMLVFTPLKGGANIIEYIGQVMNI